MQFWDVAAYSFGHLKHRGLRTWLTLLGIVVGIAVSAPPAGEAPILPIAVVLVAAAAIIYWKFFRKKK